MFVSRRRRAGIAQLVEQATENRRVPSSNLGPGIFDAKSVVSFISPDAGTDRVFDNADSFAMVFDRTWKQLRSRGNGDVSHVDHLEAVFAAMADHPFLISSPEMARQVAAFRIRLLELS